MNEPNKNILIRGLPEGTLGKLKTMADESFRSLEGEARYALKVYAEKKINQVVDNHSQAEAFEGKRVEMNTPEVQALRHSEEWLNGVIYSISRKLAARSTAVTFELLEQHKCDLAEVERKLISLGETPLEKS